MKIVLNKCWGGFGVSDLLIALWNSEHTPFTKESLARFAISSGQFRVDPRLITLIEMLGSERASGEHAQLAIVEIPDHVTSWHISDSDGFETVHENHWSA